MRGLIEWRWSFFQYCTYSKILRNISSYLSRFLVTDQENVSSKKTKEEKNENEEQGFMKSSIQQSSLPGIAVAQSSLPAATKESDGGHVTSSRGEETASGDDEEMSGSGNVEEKKDENANKPSKVKSKIHVEKDKNKIAESVKKSTVAKNTEKEKKNEKSGKSKICLHTVFTRIKCLHCLYKGKFFSSKSKKLRGSVCSVKFF